MSDTGINVLNAAFGFLEWYEDRNSERPLHAPLLLLPLSIEKTKSGRFYFYSGGVNAELNQTIIEKMKSMDVELPIFEEDDTPESFFKKLGTVFNSKPRWKLKRFVTIGIFPFQKISMH